MIINNKIDMSWLGQISFNIYGTPMKIIQYNNSADMTVEFQDQYKYQKKTHLQNFKNRSILNPYDRLAYNVGYLGVGDYKSTGAAFGNNRFFDDLYMVWRNMIERCYSDKRREKHLSYSNCLVCDKWHNYQNFADWYCDNFYQVGTERMHIDKDILYKNNNIYSPETCMIVPQRINMMFMYKGNKNNLPNGIKKSGKNRFCAMYNTKGLGTFDTIQEAINAYNTEKAKALKQVADEYKAVIPQKLYDALYNWIPDDYIVHK